MWGNVTSLLAVRGRILDLNPGKRLSSQSWSSATWRKKHNCWANKMFKISHKGLTLLIPHFWTSLSVVKQKLWPMSSRNDRAESLIFRVTGAHCVQSWLCMVRLEKMETAHAWCWWCLMLATQFFTYNSASVNISRSCSALSNTSIAAGTLVLTDMDLLWDCNNTKQGPAE